MAVVEPAEPSSGETSPREVSPRGTERPKTHLQDDGSPSNNEEPRVPQESSTQNAERVTAPRHASGTRSFERPRSPTRVRFSEEVDKRPRIAEIEQSSISQTPDPVRTSGYGSSSQAASSDRNRNRGYSLRRSLFAQNMQKQTPEHGAAMELEPTSSTTAAPAQETGKDRKGSVVITIADEEDDVRSETQRVEEPALASSLTFYSKWMKQQGSKKSRLAPLLSKYKDLRDRILRLSEIPHSVDGRHVKVNTNASFAPIDERTKKPYIPNVIRSCKYTPWNFLPKQIVAQFGKLANFYFLIVSIIQMIPGLSTTGTYTTIIPLMVFVSISMAKEGYDDIRRNRLDKEENERKAFVLDSEKLSVSASKPNSAGSFPMREAPDLEAWREIKWQDVKVGDVVLLQRDAPVPADIVLLHSTGSEGSAYIETKSLDGETNLKSKKPLDAIMSRCVDEKAISALETEFVVEDPNLDLYKFDGRVTVCGEVLPLTLGEVVYRGSILRNTNSIMGLVVYSGEECKIRMNANKNPRIKAPTLQAKVNRIVMAVAGLVIFIAVILSVGYVIWNRTFENHSWYLDDAHVPFYQIFISFLIMFNTMLPLSLYVSLEIVKVIQMFMMNDIDLYDPESDTPVECRTSTLNEELGQVNYIFSDKTGTLTNNSMKFRKMSIAGTAWLHDQDLQEEAMRESGIKLMHKKRKTKGKGRKSSTRVSRKSGVPTIQNPEDIRYSQATTNAQSQLQQPESPHCGRTADLLEYIYHRPQSVFTRKARFFLLSLALCHTCIPEKDDDGNISFQAASPDELALVTAAQELGYIVTSRVSNTITIKTYQEEDDDNPIYETYEILDVIEFSSGRKRMSVVVRLPDSRICVICKGADSTIRQLLRLADLAVAHANEIDRRNSIRKSMEAYAVIKRRSMQIGRNSASNIPIPPSGARQTSISFDRKVSMRQSVDAWLRERETDVENLGSRRNTTHITPRTSLQPGFPADNEVRASHTSLDNPRPSFQSEDMSTLIDEKVVLNDHAIFERCFNHIDEFATEGLRTLLYACRYLTPEEYSEWKQIYHAATTSIVDRQNKIEQAGQLIEMNLELVGATAIEDKLQKGVPDAIDRFRRAGIKLWMLTGDKRETAINIGHSCRLIKEYSTTVILDHTMGDLPAHMANGMLAIKNAYTAHSVLIVDGQTLTLIDTDAALKHLFADLAIAVDAVICCRASPSQKAELVKTIRTKVPGSVTLAIGDGANDIAMIQEAHLGIGIAGKEGLQAARTSDYSIAQFRFLLKLLLVHGRWNYVRVCKYTLGTFWKEMLFYLVQAVYQRWTGYTGTSLYEPWSMSMFNTLFTSLPVIFMGAFEKDLSASTLLAVPELYAMGQRNLGFNFRMYAQWMFLAASEAVIVYFIMYTIYGEAQFTRDNQLYAMGSLAFTTCVTMISLKLQFFELHNKSITAAIAMFLSIGGWWLWNLAFSFIYNKHTPIYQVNGGLLHRFGKNPLWWLTLIVIVMAVSMLEVLVKSVKTIFFPSETEIFQIYERDLETKKRFEESAAELLQQGWNRGTKKSSWEIAREEQLQAEREAEVQEILDRPRTMAGDDPPSAQQVPLGFRKRPSWPAGEIELRHQEQDHIDEVPVRKSVDAAELFRKGFGMVKKESLR